MCMFSGKTIDLFSVLADFGLLVVYSKHKNNIADQQLEIRPMSCTIEYAKVFVCLR